LSFKFGKLELLITFAAAFAAYVQREIEMAGHVEMNSNGPLIVFFTGFI
jgi:hypothetical protein